MFHNNITNNNDNIFLLVSFFLIALIIILWLSQLLYWIIIKLKSKKQEANKVLYYNQILNSNDNYKDIKVINNRFAIHFFNFNSKNKQLKLKNNDYYEKTAWNIYRNILHILLIKWKQENKKTVIAIRTLLITFYLTIIWIIICSLFFYLDKNANTNLLSILTFISLLLLVFVWMFWTMFFEKIRKEILLILEKTNIDKKNMQKVKNIIAYKTIFPGSESFF